MLLIFDCVVVDVEVDVDVYSEIDFLRSVAELSQHAARRQRELKDPWLREQLAAARAVLVRWRNMRRVDKF